MPSLRSQTLISPVRNTGRKAIETIADDNRAFAVGTRVVENTRPQCVSSDESQLESSVNGSNGSPTF